MTVALLGLAVVVGCLIVFTVLEYDYLRTRVDALQGRVAHLERDRP